MPTIISPDNYRYTNGEYKFIPRLEPKVWGDAYLDFAALCDRVRGRSTAIIMVGLPGSGKTTWANENGTSEIFFDATNLTVESRRPIIALACAQGCAVKFVFMNTNFDICCVRNNERPPDRRVPQPQMLMMRDKLKIPDLKEGFISGKEG